MSVSRLSQEMLQIEPDLRHSILRKRSPESRQHTNGHEFKDAKHSNPFPRKAVTSFAPIHDRHGGKLKLAL